MYLITGPGSDSGTDPGKVKGDLFAVMEKTVDICAAVAGPDLADDRTFISGKQMIMGEQLSMF